MVTLAAERCLRDSSYSELKFHELNGVKVHHNPPVATQPIAWLHQQSPGRLLPHTRRTNTRMETINTNRVLDSVRLTYTFGGVSLSSLSCVAIFSASSSSNDCSQDLVVLFRSNIMCICSIFIPCLPDGSRAFHEL